jgi:tetratricopeptide (TPR) repeat protein/energy-coupling factor transporter ATP-binding protein EcfA2
MIHDEVKNPFPGLRPFEFGDNHLFFGRDEQTTELTTRLRKNRFVAVVGTSGSGKSSLVRAGLMPELISGTMAGAGSSWETTIMRPGGDPITNLATAIVEADLYDSDEEDIASQVRATLTRSGLGLVEAMRQSELPEDTNFLLVVDQFEEIFRFRRSDDATDEQAAFFVNLLLEASAQADLPLYVIITMRSDFLGECSQFPRLADTVNEGEFLIPRLNRDQRKEAIVGPVKVAGGEITDRLLLRLLNDIGDDPDQLPILQHALMRTWDLFEERGGDGALDLEHYQATGGMGEALSRHADEVYGELPNAEHKRIAEKLFKSLTEKVDANRGIRRPMQLAELHEICGGEESHLREVLDAFRKTGCTFLMPAGEAKIKTKTVIDISHESLMRAWRSLRNWVDEEAQSAKIYRRLADTATLYHEDKAGLYRDPDLQISLSWREESRPNKTWANRYYPGFESAMAFLDQSQEEAEREEREREEARQREVAQAKALAVAEQEKADAMERLAITQKRRAIFASILSAIAIVATVFAVIAWRQAKESEEKAILSLVSGQELLQEDVDKALEIMKREEGGLQKFTEAMRPKAGSYVKNGDFKSALVAINAANKTDPNHKYSKLYAGRVNIGLGNFDQAKSSVNTFVKLEEESPHRSENWATIWWMFGGSIIAKTGDRQSFTNYCNKMFQRFPIANSTTGERVAKGALMMDSNPKITKDALRYTLKSNSLREGQNFYHWSCFSVGLAYFRNGDLKNAEFKCDESIEHTPLTHPWLPGLNNALLSMIYYKNGKREESENSLKIARECLNNLEGNENGLHDTILIELLIKERELLGSKNSRKESK